MAITKGTEGAAYIMDAISAFTSQASTEDGSTKVYQIDATSMRVWDPNSTIVASTGSIDKTWYDEGVDYFTGRVKMTATGLTAMMLDGSFATLQALAVVHAWTLTPTLEVGEITSIGDLWRKLTHLGKTVAVTLNRYRFDTLLDHVSETDWILLKLYENATAGYWAKGKVTNTVMTKSTGSVDDSPITVEVSSILARI